MSGADIPYQLRPNKYIDRQMFIDLLARLIIPRGAEQYIYVSMGGRHLIDHRAVYNELGLEALYSFDKDDNEVTRQRFNKPIGATICEKLDAAGLPSEIDKIFNKFKKKKNLIVWLDYTGIDRKSQLQEAVQTLIQMKHGDIFRITFNADIRATLKAEDWNQQGASSAKEYRATLLKQQLGDFVPTDVNSVTEVTFPSILIRC